LSSSNRADLAIIAVPRQAEINSGSQAPRSNANRSRPGSVVSLDRLQFEEECARLMRMAGLERQPDALVAIRTGGVFVAEAMARAAGSSLPILTITCRRPSTANKQRAAWVGALLRRLPRRLLDSLRVIEHRILTRPQVRPPAAPYLFDAEELDALQNWFSTCGATPFLLVVDDAVDSGATLSHVMSMLRQRASPGAILRSAVITVTTAAPIVTADYALYNGQLCRFPWSHDA
jgi:hypoxanthine phosphoribosyltransferase